MRRRIIASSSTNVVRDNAPLCCLVALVLAAPYRADCRTLRWTDTIPFAVPGETGFVRATLEPRDRWINGVPVLVIPDVWYYPYPRRRGLAFRATGNAPLTPAESM